MVLPGGGGGDGTAQRRARCAVLVGRVAVVKRLKLNLKATFESGSSHVAFKR